MDDSRINAKKEKKQHIQVFVRVRPTENAERVGKSTTVVEVTSNREVIVGERPPKKFTFDRVFGPAAKQIEVYNAVVGPLVEEVLAGYNCTVFAYGQTGTGKTFTMEGNNSDPALDWQSDTNAGIIPRTLSHLFDELRILEVQEYTVRVSFLELYNEEIFDLLSANDDASKLRLYEDATKKGTVIVHGLEEVTVHNKTEVYKILEKGSEKRKTAATLMNAHSSRSHTVFSITIHIREGTIEGEELLKTGKLNLVDLAGSENIGRSGAVDRRAREAGSINQSLLTLGRVITALVERAPHVPYRESKLTRLLQESLGGRTKTSIIATVSPAGINLEETLSTLDYAYRAKNITNRPELNQKLSKMALLQEYTVEIEKLKKELLVTRERNGVYLAYDNYNEMQTLIENQNKEIEKKINHIKVLQEAMESKQQILTDLHVRHVEQANALHDTKNEIEKVTDHFKSKLSLLEKVEQERDEQKHLIEKHVSTETVLLSQAQSLLSVAETATDDVSKLHEKIYRKKEVEQKNNYMVPRFKNDVAKQLRDLETNVSAYTEDLVQFCASVKNQIVAQTVLFDESIERSHQISQKLVDSDQSAADKLKEKLCNSHLRYQQWLNDEVQNTTEMTESGRNVLSDMSTKFALQLQELVENEIAENLRLLNSDISRQLDDLSTHTKNHINFISNYRQEESGNLCTKFAEIKENLENFHEDQINLIEKQQDFEKTMANAYSRLQDLCVNNRESHEVVCNSSCHIIERCKKMNDDVLAARNSSDEKEKYLQERIESDVQALSSHIAGETEKCWTVAEEAVDQSKLIISEFQVDINKSCDRLTAYRNFEEQSAREIQEKMDKDKNRISAAIDDLHMIVQNESADHAMRTNCFKSALVNASTEMHQKIDAQCATATSISNKIISQLHATRERVDGFFTRELQRDVPTGTTPGKRTFQYPRQLVKTSPHERIIQRFKEVRKMAEDGENEAVPLLNNNTPDKKASRVN